MKNLFKNLAEFQQECPIILKNTKGYGYVFADLPTIFEAINPLLKKHGLGFTQLIQGTQLETIVFHTESGEYLKSMTDIPQGVTLKGMNEFQVVGSAITYFRRYALSSALGLITDKDIDAGGESDTKKTPTKRADSEMMLPALTDEVFNNLKDALARGESSQKWGCKITLAEIKKRFVLSTIQEKAFELIEGIK